MNNSIRQDEIAGNSGYQFYESLTDSYDSLMFRLAEPIKHKVIARIKRELQRYTRLTGQMHSDEASGLNNVWEEFCVQVQRERSVYYSYLHLIEIEANRVFESLSEDEIIILWTLTDEYKDWKRSAPQYTDSSDLLIAEYDLSAVRSYTIKLMETEAASYTSKRIENYCSRTNPPRRSVVL